jgi:hypothetical protein
MSTYKEKVKQAIASAETLADVDYIREKVSTTPQINRRTIKGRELTEECLTLVTAKEQELLLNEEPFYD